MGRNVSLFSGYRQSENRTTNYCLLLLRMVYEENPKFLADVISALVNEEVADQVGVRFSQQERRGASVPDGLIVQRSFSIYIETKNFDWFYDEQLERHLEELAKDTSEKKVLLALGNFESSDVSRFHSIDTLCRERYRNDVWFRAISFEDFVNAIQKLPLPKNLMDAVSEFRGYLDEQGLLPQWQQWMDVVNCAGLPEDVLEGNVYMCPAQSGPYSHARCRYFGMYRNKTVERVAEIRAVVDVEDAGVADLKWSNTDEPESDLKALAIEKVRLLRDEYPTRVFLLGALHETSFEKDSPGGMLASKMYFE